MEEGMKIKSYRDLVVWQKSMELVTDVYEITKGFPKEEIYALTSQIRRSAVSVPSNIAEGYGRNSTQDYIRFLQIACGSLYELQTQLEIGVKISYAAESEVKGVISLSTEVERMLVTLIKKLSNKK